MELHKTGGWTVEVFSSAAAALRLCRALRAHFPQRRYQVVEWQRLREDG